MMNISRHNYEEFFLLYVDNELNVAQRRAVEEFVQQNPDLEEELVMLQQSVLRPDRHVVFSNKESLLKNVSGSLVNESNYEEYFVLYGDNELTNAEKDLVEQFVYKHPQYQEEFELIQQARVFADNAVVYPDKNDLYRSEEEFKVIPFPWRRIAAAAAILLFLGSIAWYLASGNGQDKRDDRIVKRDNPANKQSKSGNNSQPVERDNSKQEAIAKTDDAATPANKDHQASNPAPVNNAPLQQSKEIASAQKNKREQSNISNNINVTQEKDKVKDVAVTDLQETRRKGIESRPVYAVLTGSVSPNTVNIAATAKETNPRTALKMPEIEVIYANELPADNREYVATTSGKSPIRGLIRKVGRVFDKATNIGDTENDKKSLRIASFEIALK